MLGRTDRRLPPGEPRQHPLPARRPQPYAQRLVTQQPAQSRGERTRVARRHGQAGLPVRARDLGDRAAGRGEKRCARRHRLRGGQREALVQRWHTRDLRTAHQVDQFGVGNALDELDGVLEAVPLDQLRDGSVLRALADDDEMRGGMLRTDLRQGLDKMDQALERDVRAGGGDDPAGDLRDRRIWREEVGVGPDMDDMDAVGSYAEVIDDLLLRGTGDGEHRRQSARDPLLHPREAVPAAYGCAPAPAVRRVQVQLPVDGDRVVDGGDQRCAEVAEQPVPERLVVVDDVELTTPRGQMAPGAQREGQRLRKAAGPHGRDLERVDPVAVLVALRRTERVRAPVQVEAAQLGERHAVVEYGKGLRADHLDAVAEAGELAREVPYIDALAAAEGVALVGEERDAQRLVTAA